MDDFTRKARTLGRLLQAIEAVLDNPSDELARIELRKARQLAIEADYAGAVLEHPRAASEVAKAGLS